MPVTVANVRAQVTAGTSVPDAQIQACLDLAVQLVRQHVTNDVYLMLPLVVADQAVLVVAVEIFNQRKAPNGVLNQAFATPDGAPMPVRIGADPMRPAYPLLAAWVGGLTT